MSSRARMMCMPYVTMHGLDQWFLATHVSCALCLGVHGHISGRIDHQAPTQPEVPPPAELAYPTPAPFV